MLRRARTTKQLAKRIDLQYFARPHTLRRWRFWLSVLVPVVVMLWFVVQRVEGGKKTYSSGPLSQAHAVFTQQCNLCHLQQAGSFFEHASDQACLECHDAPTHHASQVFTPSCGSCHIEHKGALRLSATATAACTQCHSSLQTREGRPHFAVSVLSLAQHSEFSALSHKAVDAGQIRLNHYLHMQAGLLGPNNTRVQLLCDDCHRVKGAFADATERWPFSGTDAASTTLISQMNTLPRTSVSSNAPMAPPEFSSKCAGCHTLQFDRRFASEQVPHNKPEIVHAFLVKRFGEYIAAHPAAIHEMEPPSREIPGQARIPRIARTAQEWIAFRVDDAEWLLWAKTCKQCHTIRPSTGILPEIAKSNIAARWLTHANFDHAAHRMTACTACHARATESHETSDVLLPGIRTCQQCHQEPSKEAAEGRCFECHQYHDWSKAQRTNGRFTIPQLTGKANSSF